MKVLHHEGGGQQFEPSPESEGSVEELVRGVVTLDRWTGFSSAVLLVSCVQKQKQNFPFKQIISIPVKT